MPELFVYESFGPDAMRQCPSCKRYVDAICSVCGPEVEVETDEEEVVIEAPPPESKLDDQARRRIAGAGNVPR
jgi:rRNA maturation protein Nop10